MICAKFEAEATEWGEIVSTYCKCNLYTRIVKRVMLLEEFDYSIQRQLNAKIF